MNYTLEQKYALIKEELLKTNLKDPVKIAKSIMHKDYISPNGVEHHFLDGACFLTAYKNAGGQINLEEDLDKLMERSKQMPGATCGYWGVCGSCSSVGASLSIIHSTGPLTDNDYYKDNMELTSLILNKMSKIGGPRCCKRNAFIALSTGAEFIFKKYGVKMELPDKIICEFSSNNPQCLKERCPFNRLHK